MDLELRFPNNGKRLSLKETRKIICPARNELAFTVYLLRLYGFPSTDFSGFCVKRFHLYMVDNSAGSMISSASGRFSRTEVAQRKLGTSPTFSVRHCSSVGRVTEDLIRRSWVRFSSRSKDFFFASCGSLFPLTRTNAQWVIHGFK